MTLIELVMLLCIALVAAVVIGYLLIRIITQVTEIVIAWWEWRKW